MALMVQKISGQRSEHALPTSNGGTEPYPIPWLDKNGSNNQPAGPNLEPSHIYHFKGLVARCSTFSGVGTPHIDRIGIAYMYGGAVRRFRPGTAEFHVGPHLMIVTPHQDELQDFNRDGSTGMPYLAHLPNRTELYMVIPIRHWDNLPARAQTSDSARRATPWGRAVIVSQIISRTVVSTSLWRRPVKDTRLVNKRGGVCFVKSRSR
jgi:hypothetical protein